jgi:hypothetical protein
MHAPGALCQPADSDIQFNGCRRVANLHELHALSTWSKRMRSFLVIGLLFTLCASASAATARHPRHVIVRPDQAYSVPGWAYEPVRPPVHDDDTPSYDDPSKFGGGTAL